MTPGRDVELLELANARYRREAARLMVARERFDLGPTQFWQRVAWLLDDEAMVREHPELVLRLRRLRDQRAKLRRAS